MVTTIKITCEGVFIQSNPFYTNAYIRSVSSSSSSGNNPDTSVINGVGTNAIETAKNGNLTVVIRNNLRKIESIVSKDKESPNRDHSVSKLIDFETDDEERLYKVAGPRNVHISCDQEFKLHSALQKRVSPPSHGVALFRPPCHYMYMVRKVSATRTPATEAATTSSLAGNLSADYEQKMVLVESRAESVNGIRVTMYGNDRCPVTYANQSDQRTRERIWRSSADFRNWFLQEKNQQCVSVNENGESTLAEDPSLSETDEPLAESSYGSSNSIKRSRRATQKAGYLSLEEAAGSGMNLQSTGQTAAVGKGYLQNSTHPPTSLSGECPWFLQNPGATPLNDPPPTAPLRQHKRPAPQPGTHYTHPPQLNLPLNTVQHHLPSGATFEQQKPDPNAIQHHHTYQSTTQHSPKSPIQICASGVAGGGIVPNSGGAGGGPLVGHLPFGSSGIMSTSLNSAHLSSHGLQPQAIASNLSPANSSQSLQHIHSPGGSLLGSNIGGSAMSTSLHGTGMGGGSGGAGQLPPNNNNLMGMANSNSSSGMFVENGPNPVTGWLSGNTSLSPTTQLHGGLPGSATTAAGAPPPLLQRKCEVKLNAMPWFHGSISRDEAENLLQPRADGLFLVRESTNFPGDYTLCVCFQGKVEHYRVKYLENKLTIDDEEYFENLGQLVQHYEKDADGLCTQLVKCLSKKGRQDFCINSKDFLDRGWVIPEQDLQLRESIGKGEFGDVMLGFLRNERVAVKVLKDEGAAQKFLTEASVMTTLEHENLVKFIGLVFTSKHIYLVTEYMSKGSLVDYLRSRGRQHITRKDQINFACDTCSGMEYLEAKKVIHRDLAARNVLIAENCVAKVADFGLAREECYNLDVGKLPIKWTAPEALKGGRFSNKSDMWSFGILLWEIYSFGRVPYPRIPLADVVKHVEVGYKMEAPEGCPPEIYEMMRQSWDLNPMRRPAFAELKVKLLQLKSITN